MADYLEGRLSEKEKEHLEEHLSRCELCLDELTVHRELMKQGDQPELVPVTERITEKAVALLTRSDPSHADALKTKLKRAVNHFGAGLSEIFGPLSFSKWAFAPIRGSKTVVSDDLIRLKKIFSEFETEIEIEKISENRAYIRIRISEGSPQTDNIRVTLKRGNREIASQLLTQKDYVLFEDIPFGQYSLNFHRDGTKLGNYPFLIKESRHGRQ